MPTSNKVADTFSYQTREELGMTAIGSHTIARIAV
jgi:hypothetical protein